MFPPSYPFFGWGNRGTRSDFCGCVGMESRSRALSTACLPCNPPLCLARAHLGPFLFVFCIHKQQILLRNGSNAMSVCGHLQLWGSRSPGAGLSHFGVCLGKPRFHPCSVRVKSPLFLAFSRWKKIYKWLFGGKPSTRWRKRAVEQPAGPHPAALLALTPASALKIWGKKK